jgi:hypothetical protein
MSWELILFITVVLLIAVNLPGSYDAFAMLIAGAVGLGILMLLVWVVGLMSVFIGGLF